MEKELDEETINELKSPNFLSASQINELLIKYTKVTNVSFRLAISTTEGHFFANASEANANDSIIWIRNPNNTHWKGMTLPLRPTSNYYKEFSRFFKLFFLYPQNESNDGKPLDLSHPDSWYDPRDLRYIPEPAMSKFYDIATYGPVTEQTQLVRLS